MVPRFVGRANPTSLPPGEEADVRVLTREEVGERGGDVEYLPACWELEAEFAGDVGGGEGGGAFGGVVLCEARFAASAGRRDWAGAALTDGLVGVVLTGVGVRVGQVVVLGAGREVLNIVSAPRHTEEVGVD